MLRPDPGPEEWADFRKIRGLTQHEVADEIGCHWTLISKFERGTRNPNPELRDLLFRVYHQNPDEFVPVVTLENIKIKQLKDELTQLLRQNTEENRNKARKIITRLENSDILSSVAGKQFLFKSKAALAGHEGNFDKMYDLALKGLKISRPNNCPTDRMPFDENEIDTYNLTIDEIKLINQLAVACSNIKRSARDSQFPYERTVKILSKLRTSVKSSLQKSINQDFENVYISILYNLSKYLGLSKKYHEVITLCDEGIEIARKFRDSFFEPLFMFNKACGLLYLNKAEDGVFLLQKAYAIFAATGRHNELSISVDFIQEEFGIKIDAFNLHKLGQERTVD